MFPKMAFILMALSIGILKKKLAPLCKMNKTKSNFFKECRACYVHQFNYFCKFLQNMFIHVQTASNCYVVKE